jgi:hypothetical protein
VRGLQEGDAVLLSPPADKDKLELVRLPGSKAQLHPTGADTAAAQQQVPVKPPPVAKPSVKKAAAPR